VRYFELFDDIEVPGRWHLGEVTSSGIARTDLLRGVPIDVADALTTSITHPGRPLEFCLTSFGIPVASEQLADAITSVAAADVQRLPLRISGCNGYEVLNAMRSVACLDESQSDFMKWVPGDHRADLIGQYRMVIKLVIDPMLVPEDAHTFRVTGWPVALLVSEVVKRVMEERGCLGGKFILVSP